MVTDSKGQKVKTEVFKWQKVTTHSAESLKVQELGHQVTLGWTVCQLDAT